ncbi:MAG: hypothetical protein ACE1ZA_07795, partial [Pseudomonadales bacterium]
MNVVMYEYDYSLPWESGRSDTKRLKQWLLGCVLTVLILGIAMPWLPVPEVEREELEALPPNLARIMMEKPEPVVVPPPKLEVIEEEPDKPK